MRCLLVFIFFTVTSLCYCQTKNSNLLQAYISIPNKFEFSKSEFLNETMLKITSDTFVIIKCTVYFSDYGNKTAPIQPVTTTTIFNNLKDSNFIYLFNKREFPTGITFDDIIVQNKSGTFLRQIEGIALKVNP